MHNRWPGNVRELKNCIERAAILSEEELLRPDHLCMTKDANQAAKTASPPVTATTIDIDLDSPMTSLDDIVDQVLSQLLQACDNNKSLAAERLKVNRKMFYRRSR